MLTLQNSENLMAGNCINYSSGNGNQTTDIIRLAAKPEIKGNI